jgi:hypothetical protein
VHATYRTEGPEFLRVVKRAEEQRRLLKGAHKCLIDKLPIILHFIDYYFIYYYIFLFYYNLLIILIIYYSSNLLAVST